MASAFFIGLCRTHGHRAQAGKRCGGERFRFDAVRTGWPRTVVHAAPLHATAVAHAIQGLVNLFGIESPGLTSLLAIGKQVARLLGHE